RAQERGSVAELAGEFAHQARFAEARRPEDDGETRAAVGYGRSVDGHDAVELAVAAYERRRRHARRTIERHHAVSGDRFRATLQRELADRLERHEHADEAL